MATCLDQAGQSPLDGLLIEISQEGCRISNLGSGAFVMGQAAIVEIDGFGNLPATVRWSHDKVMGLRFDCPLHTEALGRLIAMCRGETSVPVPIPSYGT